MPITRMPAGDFFPSNNKPGNTKPDNPIPINNNPQPRRSRKGLWIGLGIVAALGAAGFGYYLLGKSSGGSDVSSAAVVTPDAAYPQKHVRLGQMFGINAFEWDFETPGEGHKIDEGRFGAIQNFTRVRHYLDWLRLEPKEGQYVFNSVPEGGWDFDIIYKRCKAENIAVVACIKTIPGWMLAGWPEGEKDSENVPLRYGKSYSDPRSYIEQAKLGYQFAARYGRTTVPMTMLSGVMTGKVYPGDPNSPVRTAETGMDLITYIECDNERNKWWKGHKAQQTAAEYAANLSAFYDGHKGTMGAGVGVKSADPTMQVVMAGLAGADPKYVKDMIDWCRKNRGTKKDGAVDLCWDVINYHIYPNDSKLSMGDESKRGAAPEVAGIGEWARQFVQLSHDEAKDMPVWVTETGYDIHPESPIKAIPIGDKTPEETQADWNLRTALLYARWGVDEVYFYQLYDETPGGGGRYGTCGFLNKDRSRKPTCDYLYQTNRLLGAYSFDKTLNANPIVDRYKLNDSYAYAITMPTEKGATGNCTIDVGKGASVAYLYTPKIGQGKMEMMEVPVTNGKVELVASETPFFLSTSQLKQ